MNNMLIIIKKELKRFFTDYRMVAAILLPGLMIFVMYSIIGSITQSINSVDDDYTYKVVTINQPEEVTSLLNSIDGFKIEFVDASSDLEEDKTALSNEEIDLIVEFINWSNLGSKDEALKPKVNLYFNSIKTESQAIYSIYQNIINEIESTITGDMIITLPADLASEEQKGFYVISLIMPYLLIIFLFTGAMSIVPESISGEKERGTIATLLVTPIKRSHLAFGKIISLSLIATLSALSSFIGILLSLPKIMGNIELSITYGPLTYLFIALILISLVVLFVVILALISAYAKSVKEANSYSGPLMGVVAVVGVFSFFGALPSDTYLSLIPVYNGLVSLTSLFSGEINVIFATITVVSNILYSVLLTILLSKMFNSERIMFNK